MFSHSYKVSQSIQNFLLADIFNMFSNKLSWGQLIGLFDGKYLLTAFNQGRICDSYLVTIELTQPLWWMFYSASLSLTVRHNTVHNSQPLHDSTTLTAASPHTWRGLPRLEGRTELSRYNQLTVRSGLYLRTAIFCSLVHCLLHFILYVVIN